MSFEPGGSAPDDPAAPPEGAAVVPAGTPSAPVVIQNNMLDLDLLPASPRPSPPPHATSQEPPALTSLLSDARANPPDLLGAMAAHVEAAPAPVDDLDFLSDVPAPKPPPLSAAAGEAPEFFDVASFCGAPPAGNDLLGDSSKPRYQLDLSAGSDLLGNSQQQSSANNLVGEVIKEVGAADGNRPGSEFETPTDPVPSLAPREVMEPFSEIDEADLQVAMESVPAIATGLRDAVSVLSTTTAPLSSTEISKLDVEESLPEVPSDLEVPGEPPTMAPMATTAVAPAGRPPPQPEPQPGPRAAFAPPSRVGHFPRAEAFLGRPLPAPQDFGAGLEGARHLSQNRSPEAALRALGENASVEAGILRLRCLTALRRYPAAAEEAARVQALQGDATDFETRVIAAHLPYLISSTNAIAALGQLQELARRACSSDPTTRSGVGGELASGEASLKEQLYILRLVSHVSLAAGYGDVGSREIAAAAAATAGGGQDVAAARRQFHSLLGRHHAAAGNTAAATESFDLAHEGFNEEGVEAWVLMDRGLLGVCRGTYASSKPIFEQAAATAAKDGGPAAAEEILAAENNLAVCRLYTRELRKGIEGLETLLRRDPVAFLRPAVVRNLVSLYEFMSDAVRRRNVLGELVAAYRLEDIDPKTYEQPGAQ